MILFLKKLFPTLLAVLFIVSCKPVGARNQGEKQKLHNHPEADIQKYADSSMEINERADFFFTLFDKSFSKKLSDLPTSGSVPDEKIPYSGYWYPQIYGGTAARLRSGQSSAIEKYDQVFNGGQNLAFNWEKEKHTISSSDPDASWAGHCNGFSAAAQRHSRPLKSVTKNGVTFEPSDIRALLAEVHMSSKYLFLGGKRCFSETRPMRPSERPNPAEMGDCEDINPGSFHLSLANWIGKMQHALIFDHSTIKQVWNFPLYRFASTVTSVTKEEAMRQVTGSVNATYRFNPKAVKFSHVKTVITHSDATSISAELTGNTGPASQPVNRTYYYILEINANDEVIGGEWTTQSQDDHPDFLWVAFEPIQGNQNKELANPYVVPDEVIKLWAESIGADPNNPPLDILEPLALGNWGHFPEFDLVLDGTSTGAVFLGKKTKLEIKRRGALVGAVSVEVTHNGYPLATLQGSNAEAIKTEFDAVSGLNRLTLTFKKNGTQVDKEYVAFHANP